MIGFGPIFATTSKQGAEPVLGLSALAELCARVHIPVVAIGGITVDNVAAVAATGVPLAAAIAALCGASDPETAARSMHRALLTFSPAPA
jgi:thiamine-phosphate pyrophosphorylase